MTSRTSMYFAPFEHPEFPTALSLRDKSPDPGYLWGNGPSIQWLQSADFHQYQGWHRRQLDHVEKGPASS